MSTVDDKTMFEAYSRDVYRLCYSMVRNRADAEDLCQDVFVRAFRQERSGIDRPKPWLMRIAMNACRTHLKRTRSGRLKEQRHFFLLSRYRAIGPDEEAERKEAGGELDKLLRLLPERIREVLVLRYVGELNLAEIAGVLDIPEGTVKSRLHKGHAKLKPILAVTYHYDLKGAECVD
jgi:RNA polymerase sigma-70 factor (ECF subfamily)